MNQVFIDIFLSKKPGSKKIYEYKFLAKKACSLSLAACQA